MLLLTPDKLLTSVHLVPRKDFTVSPFLGFTVFIQKFPFCLSQHFVTHAEDVHSQCHPPKEKKKTHRRLIHHVVMVFSSFHQGV